MTDVNVNQELFIFGEIRKFNHYPGSWGIKAPPPSPLLPLYLQNCKRYDHALLTYWPCQGLLGLSPYGPKVLSHLYTGNVNIWWRGNWTYILGNQRKLVCPTLNPRLKATDIFNDYFHISWAPDLNAVDMVS